MNGSELIAEERRRHVTEEGWSPAHDAQWTNGELMKAADCYLFYTYARRHGALARWDEIEGTVHIRLRTHWPWDWRWWKPSNDPIRNLVKSGALIAAEIDRILADAGQCVCELTRKGDRMIKLGQEVKDRITGFGGIATARVEYLNGCVAFCVKPRGLLDGKMGQGEYIDEAQLEFVSDGVNVETKTGGGPQADTPPDRYAG